MWAASRSARCLPDRIETGDRKRNQVNLFLYQVTPNPGWRNTGLPSLDSRGDGRLSNPPLALDLHYLLTGARAVTPSQR